tara:strand:- start:66 stop:509 length:444 start_codon:yes stop_codon:yes gene_type:complete
MNTELFCGKCGNLEYQYDILETKTTWVRWCVKEGITPCECEKEEEDNAELGWKCDCDNFNEWTDYDDMEAYNLEKDLKCENCEKQRPPCYERGAKGLGHPYYDMPFKQCEGCSNNFDIRTDKYAVDEEEDLMYCSEECCEAEKKRWE